MMINCLICGERITSTTTGNLCPNCLPLYKVSRPTIRQVIPSDYVSKDALRKLVVEARRMKATCSWGAIARVHGQYADEIEKLLKG